MTVEKLLKDLSGCASPVSLALIVKKYKMNENDMFLFDSLL